MPSASEHVLAPALRKLKKRVKFSDEDRAAFRSMSFSIKELTAGSYIIRERDEIKNCCVLLSGFAFRSKIVGNGRRQILSIHIPGDIVDIQHAMLRTADHNVQMLATGEIAFVSAAAVKEIAFKYPEIGQALWLETLVDGSIFREWIANVGRRDARTRISHLLCEFTVRLHAAGLTEGHRYELPMTQEQLGDATGLTAVHVNRTMQGLRTDGLISSDKRAITIENWKALTTVGDFDTAYLHPEVAQGSPP
jgi:CRP-like cAMP-binding protein